jgi:hypothetical protein
MSIDQDYEESPKGRTQKRSAKRSSPTRLRYGPQRWVMTDLPSNVPLILRNLTRRGIAPAHTPSGEDRVEIRELDWLDPTTWPDRPLGTQPESPAGRDQDKGSGVDEGDATLLLAVDCIYNPALACGLARTLTRLARTESSARSKNPVAALVVSELRESEALETFLQEWTEVRAGEGGRWRVVRVEFERTRWQGGIGRNDLVTWAGWWETE